MLETSARLLALLGLMQSRAQWSGAELAIRLDVGERTVRKDVERLRELGYPIDAARGPAGGYRLGDNGRLPPLLLDDDEAVAIAVGLGAVTGVRGIEEASALALTKLEHVLPARLRRRVSALHDSTSTGPANTGSNVADPVVDAGLLTDLAAAIRDHESVRFGYRAPSTAEEVVTAEPYRLVNWQHRWYVVARVRGSIASAPKAKNPDSRNSLPWKVFRLDWMALRVPGGGRFDPDPLPDPRDLRERAALRHLLAARPRRRDARSLRADGRGDGRLGRGARPDRDRRGLEDLHLGRSP